MRALLGVVALVGAGLFGFATAGPASPAGLSASLSPASPATGAGLFVAVTPTRLLDTRRDIGGAPPKGHSTISVAIAGVNPVPPQGATAVVVNLTVTGATAAGYVIAYPSGGDRPTASNLNFAAGDTRANLVTVPIAANGRIDIYNGSAAPVQLIGDISGYYRSTADGTPGAFVPLNPKRLLDTRNGTGGSRPGPRGTVGLLVGGAAGVPSTGVSAVVLNVTATQPTAPGYLTVYPTDSVRPTASNLNFVAGQTIANLVTVPLGTGGKVTLYNGSSGPTHLLADVEGYYLSGAPTQPGAFTPTTPDRILDTRTGTGGARPVAGGTVKLLVNGVSFIPPTGVSAVVMNVTVTSPSAGGYLTVYPDGHARPAASTINFRAGQTVPNLAFAAVGSQGRIDFYNGSSGTTQLVADVAGYFWSVPNPWVQTAHPLPTGSSSGGLTAISCAAATSCVAVGQYFPQGADGSATLIETLSDGSWTPTYPPLGADTAQASLDGVSCPSPASCIAVGHAGLTGGGDSLLVLVLSNGSWTSNSDVPLPANAQLDSAKELSSVSCVSVDTCTAVGSYYTQDGDEEGFAATRTGGTWSAAEIAAPVGSSDASLVGVSCASADGCAAVGTFADATGAFGPWIETRAGSTWSRAAITPAAGGGYVGPLNAVSCPSTTACVAVGDTSQVVTLANGKWATARPTPAAVQYLDYVAVSCVSSTACTAVGNYEMDRAGDQLSLIATLVNGSWTWTGVPEYNAGIVQLYSVSCSAATTCGAAGLTQRLGVNSTPPLTDTRT